MYISNLTTIGRKGGVALFAIIGYGREGFGFGIPYVIIGATGIAINLFAFCGKDDFAFVIIEGVTVISTCFTYIFPLENSACRLTCRDVVFDDITVFRTRVMFAII